MVYFVMFALFYAIGISISALLVGFVQWNVIVVIAMIGGLGLIALAAAAQERLEQRKRQRKGERK